MLPPRLTQWAEGGNRGTVPIGTLGIGGTETVVVFRSSDPNAVPAEQISTWTLYNERAPAIKKGEASVRSAKQSGKCSARHNFTVAIAAATMIDAGSDNKLHTI